MPVGSPKEATIPPSVRILEAIARLDGVDPLDLSPGMNTVIDTDALDRLIRHDGLPFTLEFTYETHHVLVTDEAIYIDGRETLPLE